MRWLGKWFDEANWPKDPQMDLFRDAVWELSLNGKTKGWATTGVTPMRSFPFLWCQQEQMWTQVHWLDGRHGYLEEDYGPEWPAAEELRGGHFVSAHPQTGLETRFDATVVTGPEHDRLWAEWQHGVGPCHRHR
ncbi:hypothetical protein [Kocuria turfanensis]|uniref:Uncharacterized protein n=1 Tax=Kocuria turfanensis TaxID=388357 RepID=A0A512IH43_9MICC|nr:hypothetical protein [Kocuria turfanensis]GEO97026.1 hypothetical protein KTU01_31490 [Kocuria turfanensis]